MTKNTTKHMSYFPFGINTFSDRRVKGLMRQFGANGALIYVMLLCFIYGDECVYMTRADDGVIPDLAEYCRISCEEASAIVTAAVRCGLFDREAFEELGILTSRQIQERFQEMVKPRQPKSFSFVDGRIWRLSPDETKSYIRIIGRETENKVKEKKEKENIIKEKESTPLPPELTEVVSEFEECIGHASQSAVNGMAELLADGAEAELIIRLIRYACDVGKGSWRYVKAAVRGNLDAGIRTAAEYDESRKRRTPAPRRGICNYVDTNKPDYSDFQKRIIEEMLAEED